MEKSSQFSYLVKPCQWGAVVECWQIPPTVRDVRLHLLAAVPFGQRLLPLVQGQRERRLLYQLFAYATLIYTSTCLPRPDTPRSMLRTIRLNFLTQGPF